MKRAPGWTLAIILLAVVFLMASLVAIYQAEASDWPPSYGAGLLVVGIVLMLAGGHLAKKYAPQIKTA